MKNNILVLTSGKVTKLDGFNDSVDKGSFSDINYVSGTDSLKFKGIDLKEYKVIYFRMVGKSLEVATLITDYAVKYGVKIVDSMYETSRLLPISLGKSLEMRKLDEKGIKIPKTVFGQDFTSLMFPYVVKSTTGQRAREVWLVKDEEELLILKSKLDKSKFFFAQELIPNARRIRVLVIGGRAVGAIIRHTKWNKDETKDTLNPIPVNIAKLAVDSAKVVDLNVAGIDILVNSLTNELFVIEANAAPSWKLINKYCGVIVEDEIIKYLQTKV